jgi:hypothetical protein
LEEISVTAAQATIRRLYEQVRVLETEAARTPKRRTRLPYLCVLVVAAGIGAVSAGVSHTHLAAAVHPHTSRVAAPVVHLIDPPAERARPVVAVPRRHRIVRDHVARHAVAPVRTHVVSTRHTAPAAIAMPPAPAPAPAPAASAPAPAPAPAVQPAPAPAPVPAPPVHDAPPAPPAAPAQSAHPAQPAKPAPARPAKTAPEPVGIGSVVVSTSDEPLPDDAGATTPTSTTP